jgi:hypothetical protein
MRLPLHLAVLAWGGGGGRAAKTRPPFTPSAAPYGLFCEATPPKR